MPHTHCVNVPSGDITGEVWRRVYVCCEELMYQL